MLHIWGGYCNAAYTSIGRYTCISTRLTVAIGRHPTDDFASIHPAFFSLQRQSGFTYVEKNKYPEIKWIDEKTKTAVVIGNDVWIGANVTIIDGITVGDGAVIGAGAVVTQDVEPYSIVVGIPAKITRYRYSHEIIKRLMTIQWWDRPESWIRENAEYFENVEEFVRRG